ncbi:Trk system potassium transporter TrkA [Dasania sp. GY-MA-18]|uniref:Trk system potassium uptake protein TrkA n=1 Tax=Dasania phycosphaerae TaxID=2950436 RepID=A0A9J6RQI1_9GAMM|nr:MULTISPECIES: Trk system potassium transporter TrkA [Dasania]MCR8923867.1 Trk system potassium transporter TrkA [Dasania sp. GY-MA-18]MCZ0866301.1 Trk system potassium transporter TrkA [Dasania phycosphaerae]MCZ0870025.1 Trk system potassium transporter TrkA [Dasania phycosphaerae]
MKIIILGAGQVGGTLAAHLADENNDISLVDANADRLNELQDRLDIGVVAGHASHPDVLRRAGADDADMLIAVTSSDEINMAACQIAYALFRTPKKIARIRSTAYHDHPELFCNKLIPIDFIISPELLVTHYIERLIEYPGTLQVLDFAKGMAQLVAVKAYSDGPLVGNELQEIRRHMPHIDTRVAAIFRKDHAITPKATTVIEAGDEVFYIAAKKNILPVLSELRNVDRNYKRIMIAGGGNIGLRLAQSIEKNYKVKVIERDYKRCRHLSETLNHAIVLHGSASDDDLLASENIDEIDIFCALTNDDDANIMASLLAKRMGARKVITLITNTAYVDLMQGGDIDIAISPQQITMGSLLTHIRRGDISSVHSLRRGVAEAIELIAHGDERSSKVVGKRLDEINLPKGVSIGAIVRNDEVLIAHRNIVVKTDDHVILFLVDKSKIKHVERLFQVGFSFF